MKEYLAEEVENPESEKYFVENPSYFSLSDNKSRDNAVRSHSGIINVTNVINNATEWRDLLNAPLFEVSNKQTKQTQSIKHHFPFFQDYPEWMLMSGFGCCVMFLVCGLPGNIITILALARCKKVIIWLWVDMVEI